MIIVKLIGGLGNQMFQYSLGRYLAFKYNTCLKLDILDLVETPLLENFTAREFELDVLNIQAQIATKKEIAAYIPNKTLFGRILKKIMKVVDYNKIIFETNKTFQQSVLNTNGHAYLSGYWQSEKYFSPISDLIRGDFTLKTNVLNEIDQDSSLREYRESILNSNSISIHFRREDYIKNPATNLNHGVCPEDYYYKAINRLNLEIPNPKYFLFSDEPGWLENNLKIDQEYIIVKDNKGYIDMHLMSLCKHNIIANSSFSWWGAWLNNNPDKIVIAPAKWFADNSLNSQTTDLIPEGWIRS